ncbi:hypothetical protein [Paenibacillus sp. NEAU-GSW1]|uniref:hypothetical protein n=1 Tax=Paenibacillus sp. NEAU-GSW1 TaxID=2682486 RepID=UPI001C12C100|nr:hypothetical protein [Paenibacillus sp. NEAU-GSW1]
MITCVLYALVYLIDTIGLEKNEATAFPVNGTHFQIAIFIIGLSYCLWMDWRRHASRKQN